MRNLYTIGPGNGIYKWAFFGDKETPPDLSAQYEKTQVDLAKEEQKESAITLPTFDQQQLQTYAARDEERGRTLEAQILLLEHAQIVTAVIGEGRRNEIR